LNPIAYRINEEEYLPFLLFGEVVYYRDGKSPERVWHLNIYKNDKSRRVAEKRMARGSSDIIFIEWDVSMKQIIEQGKYTTILPSDRVPFSDKMDIFKQITGIR